MYAYGCLNGKNILLFPLLLFRLYSFFDIFWLSSAKPINNVGKSGVQMDHDYLYRKPPYIELYYHIYNVEKRIPTRNLDIYMQNKQIK